MNISYTSLPSLLNISEKMYSFHSFSVLITSKGINSIDLKKFCNFFSTFYTFLN